MGPRLDPELADLIDRRIHEMHPTVNYSNGNGWKLAFFLLGALVSISIGLSAWTLSSVVDLKIQMAVISQCVTDRSTCVQRTYRGASEGDNGD